MSNKELAVKTVIGVVITVTFVGILVLVSALHHTAPKPVLRESKVLYSVPIEWHGMSCQEQSDTNGNIWINDCYTNGR